jgi:hypothetical protein
LAPVVAPRLPPPDPNESTWSPAGGGLRVTAPTAVFPPGAAAPRAERVADAVLDLRPGLLIVVTPS